MNFPQDPPMHSTSIPNLAAPQSSLPPGGESLTSPMKQTLVLAAGCAQRTLQCVLYSRAADGAATNPPAASSIAARLA